MLNYKQIKGNKIHASAIVNWKNVILGKNSEEDIDTNSSLDLNSALFAWIDGFFLYASESASSRVFPTNCVFRNKYPHITIANCA